MADALAWQSKFESICGNLCSMDYVTNRNRYRNLIEYEKDNSYTTYWTNWSIFFYSPFG
jgi:hypothetical protein